MTDTNQSWTSLVVQSAMRVLLFAFVFTSVLPHIGGAHFFGQFWTEGVVYGLLTEGIFLLIDFALGTLKEQLVRRFFKEGALDVCRELIILVLFFIYLKTLAYLFPEDLAFDGWKCVFWAGPVFLVVSAVKWKYGPIEKIILLPPPNSLVNGAVTAVLQDVPGSLPNAVLVKFEYDGYAELGVRADKYDYGTYIGMLRMEEMSGDAAERMETIAPGDLLPALLVTKTSYGIISGKPRIYLSEKAAWDFLRARHSRALARLRADNRSE